MRPPHPQRIKERCTAGAIQMKYLYLPNKYSQQRQQEKPADVYPVLLAMQATKRRDEGHEVHWGEHPNEHDYDKLITEPEMIPFLELPGPDRKFTDALNKKYQKYGNYKYTPATHMMVANSCWWKKCTFCVEKENKPYVIRTLNSIFHELIECLELGIKEIFDDSGTFPVGKWLVLFCDMAKDFKMVFGCNMRIGAGVDYDLMKHAGFRMLLYGVESANQYTLDRINKGINANDIIPEIKRASEAGLEPHLAIMCGYPWESEDEELRTIELVHLCLKKGWAKTAQASLYQVPGESAIDRHNVRKIYDVAWSGEFWVNKLKSTRSFEDFKYLLKSIKKGLFKNG